MFGLLYQLLAQFRRDPKAVTAMEYGLIAAIVSLVIVTVFTQFAGGLTATFARITASLT